MSSPRTIPSFRRRVLHVLRTDLRRERGWLLGWLLLLAVRVLDHWDPVSPPRLGDLLDTLVAVAGLALVVKLVRADAPGSDVTTSLTRPAGRGALWTAKLGFVLLALWLPYQGMHALAWRAFDLRPASWTAVLVITGLPALAVAFLAAWLASLRIQKNTVAVITTVLLILGFWVLQGIVPGLIQDFSFHLVRHLPNYDTPEASLLRCQILVAMLWAAAAFAVGWLLAALGRRSLAVVLAALVTGIVFASYWTWDWQRLPVAKYHDTQPRLRFTDKPRPGEQSLWPGLHLDGLPANQVAAVLALAPVIPGQDAWPLKESYSDFTTLEQNGQISLRDRWMRVDHARRLSESFPDHLIWVGQRDPERPNLRGIVNQEIKRQPDAAKQPWRLRLLIHEWKPVPAGNLQALGRRLPRFALDELSLLNFKNLMLHTSGLRFDANVVHRFPRLRFDSSPEPVRIHGMNPPLNLLMTAHAPMLDEVLVAHSQSPGSEINPQFWVGNWNDLLSFSLPLPIVHMDMTGLDLAEWLAQAEATLWLPVERGMIDLEISAEEMGRWLRFAETGEF